MPAEGFSEGYWRGSGRYEHGDRRDRRLTHWSYGARVDAARMRRMQAMLDINWQNIDPAGRKGKRFRTSAKILQKIALSINKVQGISFITKASIAAALGMHRNTIYKHCKAMETAGVLIQGHYSAPKGSHYKSYSVFGVPGITGRLPIVLTFRRRHARRARMVQIIWPLAVIARYGQRPLPPITRPVLVTPANENFFKNVHGTCDHQLYLNPAVQNAEKDSRKRLKEENGTGPSARLVNLQAAQRGQRLRDTPGLTLKRLKSASKEGFEGKASQFRPSRFDGALPAIERVRSVMQAFELRADHITDFESGDKLDVGYRKLWYRTIDTDDDNIADATVLYNNAAASGGILVILDDYTAGLDQYDFYHSGTVITEIA